MKCRCNAIYTIWIHFNYNVYYKSFVKNVQSTMYNVNVHVTFTRVDLFMDNESFHVNHNHSCDRRFL